MDIILASTSPYRRALLERLKLDFRCIPPDVDEKHQPGEPPGALAERLARAKAQAVADLHPDALVIGLPLNMDGSEGPRAQASRAYARNLAVLGLPILLWDERWSTTGAERGLIDQDMSRAKRAERIDSAAAAVILQGAIDALAGGII